MPRVARKWCNSPILHVMTHGINQEYIFSNDIYKRKYIYALNKYVQKYNVNLMCYCIMDNHSHLLIKSKNIYKISEYMRSVNTTFALFYNKSKNRKGYVFRNRFKSQPISSEKQLYTCINYIYNNPIKAGICKDMSKYLYSNYSEFINNNQEMEKKILEHDNEKYFEDFIEDENIKDRIQKNKIRNKNNIDLIFNKKLKNDVILYLHQNRNMSYYNISKIIGTSSSTVFRIVKNEIKNQKQ